MSRWPVQDAKARFSEMLEICLQQGPQIVSKRGVDTAVLVPIDQWQRLQAARPPLMPAWQGVKRRKSGGQGRTPICYQRFVDLPNTQKKTKA